MSLEALKERARQFVAQGRCRSCGAEAVYGRTKCVDHLAYERQYQRERRKRLRQQGVCVRCRTRAPRSDSPQCTPCRDAMNRSYRQTYWRRRNEGLCVDCGVDPAVKGRTRCEDCRQLVNDAKRERDRQRRRKGAA